MKKLTIIFLIGVFLFFWAGGEGYCDEILFWPDCVKEAEKNHPDLVSAREKLNESKADKAITVSGILPQISVSGSQSTSRTASGKDRPDSYSYGVSGEQLVFDGFKLPYDIASTSRDLESSQYSYKVTSSDVRLQLRTAFIDLLKAQELLGITETIALRRSRNVELVKLRYEAGREHKGALLTAQANSAQADFEAAQAKRNISVEQRRLIKELGRMKFSPIEVKGDFAISSSDEQKPNFEELAENTPFLRELIVQKESARFSLKSAKADLFPKIYAVASAGRTSSSWPPVNEQWSVGGKMSFSLFEGGSNIAKISKAKALMIKSMADERSGRDGVILTLEETYAQLQDALDNVGVQKKFLEASVERAKIAQAQYSTGLISFDDWTIIEDDLVKVKKSFLNAQSDYLIVEAVWVQAKGGTLDE